jgi:uncharacterized protein (TIGR00288 family)
MSQDRDTNLALFIDFDNVALGARDARQRFDVKLLLQRVLEKGKIIVKRAYADWHYYKEHMSPLHEAAIELIEIPMPRISGKNSADIKLVVDAMDLCYSKEHIDTFVIVSGDSDFSPLVSKLRENNKRVIGIGVKNSSSHLLINNCDEFMFYDDIYRNAVGQVARSVTNVPADKRDLFDFLVSTAQSLLQESRGVLYSSLIKDTMTRKQPDFNERNYGYANFGELLEEARRLGLLIVERDVRAGGTWVVQGLGEGSGVDKARQAAPAEASGNGTAGGGSGSSRSSRRRRSRGRGRSAEGEQVTTEKADAAATPARSAEDGGADKAAQPVASGNQTREAAGTPAGAKDAPPSDAAQDSPRQGQEQAAPTTGKADSARKPVTKKAARKTPARKAATKKATTKKATARKAATKKAATKKAASARKPVTKKAAKKPTTKKPVTKKAATKKAATKKVTTKKAAVKKAPARKKTTKKAAAKKE